MNKHAKEAVLDNVWKNLEKATWIQDGQKNAPRIVYVFSDPNCPYFAISFGSRRVHGLSLEKYNYAIFR